MNKGLYYQVVQTKHSTNADYHMLSTVRLGTYQTVTCSRAYTVITLNIFHIYKYDKHIVFLNRVFWQACAAILKGIDYHIFDFSIKVIVKAKIALHPDTDDNMTLKSVRKHEVAEK
jgi:hypothetical protein